jgi:hypothetical protein
VDPALVWWNSREILRNGLLGLSPFQYVRNNPRSRFDIDGFVDKDGNRVFVGVETEKTGHAYVYVQDKAGNNVLYSYGRYDGGLNASRSSGGLNPVGAGVLLRYVGQSANEKIVDLRGRDGGAVYEITQADGTKIKEHYDSQYESGQPSDKEPENGRVVDTYVAPSNTCITSVSSALEAGGTGEVGKVKSLNTKTGKLTSLPPVTVPELKKILEEQSQTANSGVLRQP